MAAAANSSNSLDIEGDFNELVLNKYFIGLFWLYKLCSYCKIYNWKAYCYINFFQILNCQSTKKYWFVALDIEFE